MTTNGGGARRGVTGWWERGEVEGASSDGGARGGGPEPRAQLCPSPSRAEPEPGSAELGWGE